MSSPVTFYLSGHYKVSDIGKGPCGQINKLLVGLMSEVDSVYLSKHIRCFRLAGGSLVGKIKST